MNTFGTQDLEVLGRFQWLTEEDPRARQRPGLTPEKLAIRLHIASSVFTSIAQQARIADRVAIPEPPGIAVPPAGEMMALALALERLIPGVGARWKPGSEDLAAAWTSIPVGSRRQALEDALVELAFAGVWGPPSALDGAPVAVDQLAVVLAPRPAACDRASSSFAMQEAAARGPWVDKIVGALGPDRAIFWGPGDDQAEALQAAFAYQAAILVMHWDSPIPPSLCGEGQRGPRLGLGPGHHGPYVDGEDLLPQVVQGVGAGPCRAVELAVCHGWRLASAWKGRIGEANVFGLPGFRSEELILESIAEMAFPVRARQVFGSALAQVYLKPFYAARQLFHALCAIPRYYSEDEEPEHDDDDEFSDLFDLGARIRGAVRRGDSGGG